MVNDDASLPTYKQAFVSSLLTVANASMQLALA
jgi:hypothetical protein